MTNNSEAERSVLGAMLRSHDAIMKAITQLRTDDFSETAHRVIFSAMLKLAISGKGVDLITLDDELTKMGKLETVGGAPYLIELHQSVPTTANMNAYMEIVLENANKRRLGKIAESINRKLTTDMTADNIIELVEGACNDIIQRKDKDGGWTNLGDAVIKAFELAENPRKKIRMGFKELDDIMCGGLKESELTIVGARPGRGKSAFMLAVGMNAAANGAHIGYLSLEMSTEQIAQRALAATSRVSITKQQIGRDAMTDDDWVRLADGVQRVGELKLNERFHIYEGFGMTIERLQNIAKHAARRGELDLLVIDYIQLLQTTERTSSDFERIGKVSRGLKRLALQLNIPILTAAQVLRSASKENRAPNLDELRGSGDLEQDADNVLLIHSPEDPEDTTLKYIKGIHEGIWERSLFKRAMPFTVQVAKQRQGATGRTWCLFKPEIMKFYDDPDEGE